MGSLWCGRFLSVAALTCVRVAELDLLGVELLPAIQAEKNQQALEEARAHLNALTRTQRLKDNVDAADIRTLEIQRDRALNGRGATRKPTPSACR